MAESNENFTYTWLIANYSLFNNKYGCDITSPTFDSSGIHGHLSIFPRGEESDTDVHFSVMRFYDIHSLQLKRTSRSYVDEIKNIKLELCSAENETLVTSDNFNKEIEYPMLKQYVFLNLAEPKVLENKLKNCSTEDTLVVRCQLTIRNGAKVYGISNKDFTAKTVLCCDEYSFMLKAGELSDWNKTICMVLGGSNFEIAVRNPDEKVLLKIKSLEEDKVKVLKCKISFFDLYGIATFASCYAYRFQKGSDDWCFPTILLGDFYGKSIKFSFSASNGLTMQEPVEGTMHDDPSSLKHPGVILRVIPDDAKNMFLNEKDADLKFRIDEEVIFAHMRVLSEEAPMFAAIFKKQQDTMEKKSTTEVQEVCHVNMSAKSFKSFLKFIYTDMFEDIDSENALELLLAAEKYGMPALKNRASNFLASRLTNGNACDVATVANKVKDQFLKSVAINFIKRNIKEISSSQKWFKWIEQNGVLCSEIICSFSEDLQKKK